MAKIGIFFEFSPYYRHFLINLVYLYGMEYKKSIVGRHHEQDILQMCYNSPKAEFVAVYGRRRIGKTYLVKQFFQEQFDFDPAPAYGLRATIAKEFHSPIWQESP